MALKQLQAEALRTAFAASTRKIHQKLEVGGMVWVGGVVGWWVGGWLSGCVGEWVGVLGRKGDMGDRG
jgi:hypothetical protein